jgi:peroxiredoxin
VGTQPVGSLDAPGGTIGSSELKGRVVVVSFWDSDCGACLDLLPELGSLTRRLRARGRDVVLVAVSADAEQAPFDDVYRLGQRWGELVRSPELAATWGVPRLPSTYVIDRSGVIVYQVNHRIRDDELEPVLLKAAM